MAAVWIRAFKELRARWRAWLIIALMVGVAGGVVMAAATGARRSDSAVPRFMAYAKAQNAFVGADPSQFEAIAELPQVESAAAVARMLMTDPVSEKLGIAGSTLALMSESPRLAPPLVLFAGRQFDLANPREAMINLQSQRDGVFKIGSTVTLHAFSPAQLDKALSGANLTPDGPTATVTVVGVIKMPTDLTTSNPPKGVVYTGNDDLFVTPALYKSIGAQTAQFAGMGVRLRRGDKDLPSFTKAVMALTHNQAFVGGGSDDLQAAAEAQRATHTEAIALWLFTALAGGAALAVIGQSISRQIFVGSSDNATLLAIGMTRGQLVMAALLHVLMTAVAGALLAVSTAILLSPLTPLGLAREAEVDIGFHLDLPVLLIGAAGCIVLLVARAALPAWLASRSAGDASARHPSRSADTFARAGMPASSVAGVQMALDPGRGRNAVPVRTAIAGSVLATAVVVTAIAFGASLGHLAGTPRLQGWTWDYAVGNPHAKDDATRAIPLLRDASFVGGASAEAFGSIVVDGRVQVTSLGLQRITGEVTPPMLGGRAPRKPGEIAFGTKALRVLKKKVGDSVVVSDGDKRYPFMMRIVGRAVIDPGIVNGQISLGDGAVMSLQDLRRFVPAADQDQGAVNVFLVKIAPGVDRRTAEASLQKDFPHTVLTPYAPAEVENLRRIDGLPSVLAALLGLLALATIAHALVTSVRRRRHDLAILKTLGFVRGQVFATVAWQASTLAVLAGVVGLAAGVIGGRWLWIFYATRLGLRPEPAVPLVLLIIAIPFVIALANVIAAVPGRSAARTEPALVLRTE